MVRNLQHADYFQRFVKSFRLKPTQVIILSFVFMILLGTLLLMLPISTTNNLGLSAIDALFVSTSASCVTGLTVVDLHNDLTIFGTVVMLMLIQVGGHELFVDEGIELLKKATAAQLDVTLSVYAGMSHDFSILLPELDDSIKSFAEIKNFVNLYMPKTLDK